MIQNLCVAASAICLALAYFPIVHIWAIALGMLAALLFWVAIGKGSTYWTATSLLAVYFVAAVMAVLLKGSVLPVILGSLSALLWWDLMDFAHTMNDAEGLKAMALLQAYRLRSLAIVVGVSLLLEGAGLWLRFQLPFGVILLLVLLTVGCILYATRLLRPAGPKPEP